MVVCNPIVFYFERSEKDLVHFDLTPGMLINRLEKLRHAFEKREEVSSANIK